ncbi:MAG: PLP-dependent aminotransferase family protein [Pyrinomonadaceae bacterium]|nr:PLP-dependent aminotransferase family protein [Pyrinomonadaceae bacterium]
MSEFDKENSSTAINLNKKSNIPLYRQFYEKIRVAILNRQYSPGYRLPATREAAREFGVSRNTVATAYDQLVAEGYLEARSGSGTYVSEKLPDDLLYAKTFSNRTLTKNNAGRELSKRGKLIARTPVNFPFNVKTLRPFAPCLPSAGDFPFQIWAKIISRRLRRPARNLLNYGEAAGYRPLREEIAAYLATARAVKCSAEQVIIVSGAQQAIDLTARILLDRGDKVWTENPGYLGARGAFIAAETQIISVPVDEEGIRIEIGKQIAPDAKLICVTPSHQYPLGVTMSLARRLELLKWANSAGAWILEDDYDSEFRYENRPFASLQGLDNDNRVIYVGTFSKILSPALRIGYLVAPPDLVNAFAAGKALLDRHSSLFEQMILADFFHEGHFARHLRRMRNLYAERRDIFISAVESEANGKLEIAPSAAGLHLVGWLEDSANDLAIVRRASENGVDCEPLSALTVGKNKRPGLVLGYAAFDEKEIKRGVKKLAAIL